MTPTKLATMIGVSLILACGNAAEASNGYFTHGFGTRSKAMAGAGTAMPLDAMAAATNPALMVHLGNRVDLGMALFKPTRGFTANAPTATPVGVPFIPTGTFDSDKDLFFIPHVGWNKQLDANSSIGISVGGNGGMNTDYPSAVFQNFAAPGVTSQPTGIDLMQLFVGLTYSRKLSEEHSVGITPIFSVQSLEVQGLEPFEGLSLYPTKVTNNGHDESFGAGMRLGWYWKVSPDWSVGASYQSRIYMSPFSDYKGLLAEGGDFDIPPILNLGVAVKVTPEVTVLVDYQEIFFGDIKSMSNPNDIPLVPGTIALGTDDGLGFGWEDMSVLKLGINWELDELWTLRAGYSIAEEVLPSTQALFNILAPATVTDHITMGFSYKLDDQQSINFSYMHALNEQVHGTNPNTPLQTGYLEMNQHEVEVSWSKTF